MTRRRSSRLPRLTTAAELLRQLSPAEIRERIASIDAERKALMVLLRAALRAEVAESDAPSRRGGRDAQ